MARPGFAILICMIKALCIGVIVTIVVSRSGLHAQTENDLRPPRDAMILKSDTIPGDSLTNDTIPGSDTTTYAASQKRSDIETMISYTARDSITADTELGVLKLYGEAVVIYGEISLEAEEIVINYRNHTITALSVIDSSGNDVGYPVFKNGLELYETKGMVYNYKTKRAKIREVVTRQGESLLASETAFKNEGGDVLSLDNSYTTCDLEHPHFKIKARKTKAIKDDKVVTGPFYMELNDIPMPLGFLFGVFPGQQESKSGIIFPSYGEEHERGFNLRNGGYFFDVSEYLKASITADVYSKGAHALYLNSSYVRRYRYNGGFNFSYSRNYTSDHIEDRTAMNDYRISWHHSPQGKRNSRFSASVDAATATFNQNNNLTNSYADINSNNLSNISASLSSNISYSKTFARTPFSMATNFTHNQNLVTRQIDLLLPNLSITMQNQYPFQKKRKPVMLENLSVGYSLNGSNRVTNNLGDPDRDGNDSIAAFGSDNFSTFLQNSRKGIRQSIPISNSLKLLNYLVISPSINYEEKWYFEKLDWAYDPEARLFTSDTLSGFNRIANYSFSASLTTKFFGMFFIKNRNRNLKAIRHVINPNVSFSYTPDFTDNENYFQKFTGPEGQEILKSRHEGFLYGPSSASQSASIGFSLGNNLEMKIKSPKDTAERKAMLINNLSFATSYNLLAESFKLAPISMSANTTVLKDKVNVNLSGTLDPYSYVTTTDAEGKSREVRVDSYAWKEPTPGRLTSASLSLNGNLNPEKQKKDNSVREEIGQSSLPNLSKQYLLQDPMAYVDFSIPWSVNLGFNISYRHPVNTKSSFTQTLQASGDLAITDKWRWTYNTGYDFEAAEFTQTSLGLTRDLHCWMLNLSWVPFGKFQSYDFHIAIKASMLKDLKVEKRRSFIDQ
jgi:hypothetical protein